MAWSDAELDEARRLVEAGWTYTQIGDVLGASYATTRWRLRRAGIVTLRSRDHVRITRICLKCRVQFTAASRFLRLCSVCRSARETTWDTECEIPGTLIIGDDW